MQKWTHTYTVRAKWATNHMRHTARLSHPVHLTPSFTQPLWRGEKNLTLFRKLKSIIEHLDIQALHMCCALAAGLTKRPGNTSTDFDGLEMRNMIHFLSMPDSHVLPQYWAQLWSPEVIFWHSQDKSIHLAELSLFLCCSASPLTDFGSDKMCKNISFWAPQYVATPLQTICILQWSAWTAKKC